MGSRASEAFTCVSRGVLGGEFRIHPENARRSGRNGAQYVAQCVARATLTQVVWQCITNICGGVGVGAEDRNHAREEGCGGNILAEECSASEARSYLRLMDFASHNSGLESDTGAAGFTMQRGIHLGE